jgi:Phosphatidylglycerophosphate synthase
MEKENRKKNLEASLKSLDTEEFIDIHFYRPIGYRWALFFNKLGITPNSVTIASIFLGVAAGVLFYYNDITMTLCGIFMLIWANSYDSADGQLARLTGQKSELGRILDGTSGDFWFITIYASICLRLYPEGWGIWIWILAAITGFCHSKQAAMADYYRNIHLFFLKGKAGSELDNSLQQKELYKSLLWKNDFIRKLFIFSIKTTLHLRNS